SSRATTTSSPSVQVSASVSARLLSNAGAFGPRPTASGAAPGRSATAPRAAAPGRSAGCDAGTPAPGADTGARIAVDTAEATCSGTNMPAEPSRWIHPSPKAGNNPRIRATSNAMPTRYGPVISQRVRGCPEASPRTANIACNGDYAGLG